MQPTPEQETVFLTILVAIGPMHSYTVRPHEYTMGAATAYVHMFDTLWAQAFGRASTMEEWYMFGAWCDKRRQVD